MYVARRSVLRPKTTLRAPLETDGADVVSGLIAEQVQRLDG
jgi:hypothetical protein